MNRRFRRGLVVGKFCPLHLGHEFLIGQARENCDELIVLSYTEPGFPGYDSRRREVWLKTRFPDVIALALDNPRLAVLGRAAGIEHVPAIPADDATDDVHRRFVAWFLDAVLGKRVDGVFTSEDYGEGFAEILSQRFGHRVEHVCVDKARHTIPISGTRIRADVHACRAYLSAEVHASFVRRICLLGGESSGKTTLAAALAETLKTAWVAEYGRELWELKQGRLQLADMLAIATTQIQHEEAAVRQARRFLVCDTSPLTTAFYSQAMFGQIEDELSRLADRAYDLTLLCAPDFEFVQDGTRRDHEFRMRQHQWYVDVLANKGVDYYVLQGALEQRVAGAVSLLGMLR
ncbi:MAG: AAA family ATPase [Azonexus sp.]|uniref:AAA family ATPase n=1 Tax=Azonexus sp. TaxID=1872668 RepID=UPI00281DC93A|nr:AAA family ATPase [Azonexus sp.]MDR0775664.1 AAA family ATPase [Azonexus sp.]